MKKYAAFSCLFLLSCFQAQPVVNDSIPKEIKSVTKHKRSDRWQNHQLYGMTAGALILRNEKDEPVALIGYTAYTKDGETDLTKGRLLSLITVGLAPHHTGCTWVL